MKYLVLLFLVACTGLDITTPDGDQCSPRFVYTPYGDISSVDSYCLCRPYRFSREYIGSTGAAIRLPISSCDKLIGWQPIEYAKKASYWEQVRRAIQEHREN